MTVADLSTVWVSSQVPEKPTSASIQPREKVEIRLVAYPDDTFEGRVRQIADNGRSPDRAPVKVHAEASTNGRGTVSAGDVSAASITSSRRRGCRWCRRER